MKEVKNPWAPYSNRPTRRVAQWLVGEGSEGTEQFEWCSRLCQEFTNDNSDWRQTLEAFLMMAVTNAVSHGVCVRLFESQGLADTLGASLIYASLDEVRFGEVAEAVLKRFEKWDAYASLMEAAGQTISDLWSPDIAKALVTEAH